jgi:protein CpxP
MNKLIITIISILMLSVSSAALAQNPDGGYGDKGKRHQRGMQGNPFVEQVMRGIKRLDLEDEQRASIREIMQTLKADSNDLMSQTRAGHMQLRALITAENYDEAAVAELAEKEGELATERMILSSQALSQIYAQLNEEQQAELDAMAAERMAKRAERGERRKQRFTDG